MDAYSFIRMRISKILESPRQAHLGKLLELRKDVVDKGICSDIECFVIINQVICDNIENAISQLKKKCTEYEDKETE